MVEPKRERHRAISAGSRPQEQVADRACGRERAVAEKSVPADTARSLRERQQGPMGAGFVVLSLTLGSYAAMVTLVWLTFARTGEGLFVISW